MGVAATPAPLGLGPTTRPKRWQTLGSFSVNHYLKIRFPKFLGLDQKIKKMPKIGHISVSQKHKASIFFNMFPWNFQDQRKTKFRPSFCDFCKRNQKKIGGQILNFFGKILEFGHHQIFQVFFFKIAKLLYKLNGKFNFPLILKM